MIFLLLSSLQAEEYSFSAVPNSWITNIEETESTFFLGGKISDSIGRPAHAWLAAWNEELQWQFQAKEGTDLQEIIHTEDQLLLCGNWRSQGLSYPWIARVDLNGNLLSEEIFEDYPNGLCTDITETDLGWVAVFFQTQESQSHSFFLKFDSDATLVSTVQFPIPSELMAIEEKDSSFFLAGYTARTQEDNNGIVALVDPNFSVVWMEELGGSENDKLKNLSLSEQGIISCGYTMSNGAENWDIWMLEYSWSGEEIWSYQWGGAHLDGCKDIEEAPDGRFHFIGDTQSFDAEEWDILSGIFDPNTQTIEYEIRGGSFDDYGYDISFTEEEKITAGVHQDEGIFAAWLRMEQLPLQEEELDTTERTEEEKQGCSSNSQALLLPLALLARRRKRHCKEIKPKY